MAPAAASRPLNGNRKSPGNADGKTVWRQRPSAANSTAHAPVAQLDRALPSEGRGHRFESCRVRQSQSTFRTCGFRACLPRRRGFESCRVRQSQSTFRTCGFRACLPRRRGFESCRVCQSQSTFRTCGSWACLPRRRGTGPVAASPYSQGRAATGDARPATPASS
jgi:hypothetical protein